jgi:hypothetical protein
MFARGVAEEMADGGKPGRAGVALIHSSESPYSRGNTTPGTRSCRVWTTRGFDDFGPAQTLADEFAQRVERVRQGA